MNDSLHGVYCVVSAQALGSLGPMKLTTSVDNLNHLVQDDKSSLASLAFETGAEEYCTRRT